MPEAPVDENGHLFASKGDVDRASAAAGHRVLEAKAVTSCMRLATDRHLGRRVVPAPL
jgi:hypothetical protein